jgi:hypothetical protein
VRIPQEVAVASFDGTTESEFCWPPLTVAQQNLAALAAAAIDLLAVPRTDRGSHVEIPTREDARVMRLRHHRRVLLPSVTLQPAAPRPTKERDLDGPARPPSTICAAGVAVVIDLLDGRLPAVTGAPTWVTFGPTICPRWC